jgi:hypothetical protein
MNVRSLSVLALAFFIPLISGTAAANVIHTYSVDGSFGPGGLHDIGGTLSGTLTVDATAHLVTAADIVASTIPGAFNVVVGNHAQNPGMWVVTLDNVPFHTTFLLQMNSAATLFAGSTTTIDSSFSGFFGFGYFGGDDDGSPFRGTLTIAAVPEPSTWAMLLIGFAGIWFAAYRRKSKPALTVG